MVAPSFSYRSSGTTAPPIETLKRRFYLVMLSLLVLSGALSTLLFTEGYFFDRVFTPLLLLVLAGFTFKLWRHPASLPLVERGVTLTATLGYTFILAHTLYLSPEEGVRETFLEIFRLWGLLIYVWAYLALGSRRGLLASLAFYGATLAVSFPYLLSYPPEDLAFGGRYLLGRLLPRQPRLHRRSLRLCHLGPAGANAQKVTVLGQKSKLRNSSQPLISLL